MFTIKKIYLRTWCKKCQFLLGTVQRTFERGNYDVIKCQFLLGTVQREILDIIDGKEE